MPRDLPAFGVSVAFHVAILAILGVMGIAAQAELKREITSRVVDSSIPSFDQTEIQDIDQPDLPAVVNSIGSSAPEFSVVAKEGAAPPAGRAKADGDGPTTMLVAGNVSRPGEIAMPSAMTIAQDVSIKGTGAEHVGGVEGAVDRVAMELLNRLERGKTLVVWAFDASRSLLVEREKLAKHIEQVYAHINQLDKDQVAVGDALMTMVVGFGQTRKAMLPRPPATRPPSSSAIREVPDDTTGIETTFQTVTNIVKSWGKFKDAKGQAYQTIVIVVTDEVGDDQPQLESAIATASAAKVPVYVLGSPALFGKVKGRMNFTDPKTKKTYYNLEVTQGPESVAAGDDPPALLVRRRPVRQPRRRLRPLRPQPTGRRHRRHLLHHPDGQQPAQLRPQRDARVPPRLDERRPVRPEPPEGPDPGGRHPWPP